MARNVSLETRGAAAPAISVENVSIEYGTKGTAVLAVEDVSFEMRSGERFIIIGPSGCGKTTLLMSIAGFLAPVSGTVSCEGIAVRGPGPDRAVVFQDFDQLFPWRTVQGNLTYALKVTGGATGDAGRQVASEYLELVQIAHASNRFPHQLSGGMKQRAAIARALSIKPSVLLMDEPFGAIDEITRTALQKELDRICRATNVTLIMVTHSIQEAALLGDRVMVMSSGPGKAREIVDTSAVTDLDSPEFGEAVAHLRGLLDDSQQPSDPGDPVYGLPARERA